MLHRARVLVLAAILVAIGFTVPSPAQAASTSGALAVRGPGSVYTGTSHPSGLDDGNYTFVSQAVGAGQTISYGIEVFNTGAETAQYKIKLEDIGGPARKTDLLAGSLVLTTLSAGPDGYVTNPIAPGKFQALTMKVTVPAGTPQTGLQTYVHLLSTSGAAIDTAWVITEIKAAANGTHKFDVFARQGSQPFVGGTAGDDFQVATAPAQKVGVAATFNVKVQNNLPQASEAAVYLLIDPNCTAVTVKDGSADVTAGITQGNYYITTLVKPGGFHAFTVTMKKLNNSADCFRFANGSFVVNDLNGPYPDTRNVVMLVPQAYS